jgi:hypothetical protein
MTTEKTTIRPPVVLVTWEDACRRDSDVSWVETNPEKPTAYVPEIVASIGFLLFQSEAGLVLSDSWSADHTGPLNQIPKGMVRAVEFLEPVKSKRTKR